MLRHRYSSTFDNALSREIQSLIILHFSLGLGLTYLREIVYDSQEYKRKRNLMLQSCSKIRTNKNDA